MSVVYKITNQVNGAVCVGISQLTLEGRWAQMLEFVNDSELARSRMPCLRIITSMKKYGVENFTIDPLLEGVFDTPTLEKLEMEQIHKLNEQGITVYHRTGTYVPNEERIDTYCSVDEDDDYFYG